MISSKDDPTTASLLGFAIANRVEPNSAQLNDGKDRYLKEEIKEGKAKQDKDTSHTPGPGKNKDGPVSGKEANNSSTANKESDTTGKEVRNKKRS